MPAQSFFRDVQLPSHRQDRLAHQRYLVAAHVERRGADEPRPASLFARLLALASRRARS